MEGNNRHSEYTLWKKEFNGPPMWSYSICESKEDFEWLELPQIKSSGKNYFTMINNSRRTIEVGEQVHISYGASD